MQATMDLRRLATHVWYLMGALLLLHLACCIAALVTIGKQKVYLSGVSDAGERGWTSMSVRNHSLQIMIFKCIDSNILSNAP